MYDDHNMNIATDSDSLSNNDEYNRILNKLCHSAHALT